MTTPEQPLRLQVTGTVNPRKHLFVSRQDIEDELYDNLARGEYCNILSSRQVGKSSVMLKTALRLKEDGIRVVTIDVAGELGTPETATDWYQGFLTKVVRDLQLDLDVGNWWKGQSGTANQRLMEFFRTQLFAEVDSRVVIFVDEIDSTIKLPYTDDFFTAIRTMYNQRGSETIFEQVAFCLIGVASPNELVKDRRTTSYNVGRTIEFRDFDAERDDLSGLVFALAGDSQLGEQLLQAVLDWTGGHPYLTIWLCQEIHDRKLTTVANVNSLAEETFASVQKVDSNVHFQQISRYLGERVSDKLAALRLYESILQGNNERDKATPTHIELKLSGIVRRNERGNLEVRNRIYRDIFNQHWVQQSTPRQTLRYLRLFAIAATILLLAGGAWFTYDRVVLEPTRQNRIIAAGQVEALLVAEITEVPDLIDRMRPYRKWTDPLLRRELQKPDALSTEALEILQKHGDATEYLRDQNRRLRASLALLETDHEQIHYLWRELFRRPLAEASVIASVLGRYAADDTRELVRKEIPSLRLSPDPTARSYLIHLLVPLGIQPDSLAQILKSESRPAVRRTLLLGLGQFPNGRVSSETVAQVERIYVEDADGGTHSAAGWALRQQGLTNLQLEQLIQDQTESPETRDWEVIDIGEDSPVIMLKIPAGDFAIGEVDGIENPKADDVAEPFEEFWLSDREVSVGQFYAVMSKIRGEKDVEAIGNPLLPVARVTWFDALEFCNTLSERKGFKPPFYYKLDVTERDEDGSIANAVVTEGVGKGYRLPTEREWEYACRAGSTTDYCFGNDANLLDEYGVYRASTTAVCGSKMPNRWGLFDMHGNVGEWCWDLYIAESRVLRGGSFYFDFPRYLRSAYRSWSSPDYRYYGIGFRISRTP